MILHFWAEFHLYHHYHIIFYHHLKNLALEFPLQFKIGFEGQGIIWRYSNVSIPSEFSRDHSGLKMERHALEFGWLSVSSQTKINELVNGFAIFLATKYKENFFLQNYFHFFNATLTLWKILRVKQVVVLNVIEQYQEISTPPNPNPKNLLLSPPPPFRDFYPWFDDVPMFHTK